ncbi:uncharacterized protein LOC8054039 [Ixodes scapularis]|uniref:uncharacterized protein LOC8054039 n=1 Tax=Ixodes scapularis TaxID=6945 RepID=UPI001A9FBCD2|nr:uncharacterized protein LOC8054039 [Ixodes scapularis]
MDSPTEHLLLKPEAKVNISCPVRTRPPGRRLFGVRCHLHRFYADNPGGHRRRSSSYRNSSRRTSRIAWTASIWTGSSLLALGAVLLVLGYAAPRTFIRRPTPWRLAGLVAFCSGGCLLAAALMLAALCPRWNDEDAFAPAGVPQDDDDDLRVPVTEKITAVQPLPYGGQ